MILILSVFFLAILGLLIKFKVLGYFIYLLPYILRNLTNLSKFKTKSRKSQSIISSEEEAYEILGLKPGDSIEKIEESYQKNTFFDNLCHVAHNVVVGNNCIFAAMTGIAGSTKIGNNVMTGGQVGIAGHLNIGNNVQIAAQSGVLKDLDNHSSVMGHPAIDKFKYIRNYKKNYA